MTNPFALAALATACAMGTAIPSMTLHGQSKPSSKRSNFTPIWNASVQPALSYGGFGGPPGKAKSFGWSCGSNMSSTCGRNAWADLTTYELAG
jgi:hypothetical protein